MRNHKDRLLKAYFCFYSDLQDFLPPTLRQGSFFHTFEFGQTLKHLIESLGVPHTEVGPLLASGQPVGFDYQVQDGDEIAVHPASADANPPPDPVRFVLDNHLGRLAAYLRMLGFDSIYRNDFDDEELARISSKEDRILLTRDRRLLMRRSVRYGYCLRSMDSQVQAEEVLNRFNLFKHVLPFQRCLRCNAPLEPIHKDSIIEKLEPLTRQYFDEFHRCQGCQQIYWKGSHFERMQNMIIQISTKHQEQGSSDG
jgi:uncharacterized protein